jgi:hypothetical protein
LLVLGKSPNENRPVSNPEDDYRSKPAGFSAAAAGDPLLDDTPAQIGIDKTRLGIIDCPTQVRVRDPGLSGEARERLRLKRPHTRLFPRRWEKRMRGLI